MGFVRAWERNREAICTMVNAQGDVTTPRKVPTPATSFSSSQIIKTLFCSGLRHHSSTGDQKKLKMAKDIDYTCAFAVWFTVGRVRLSKSRLECQAHASRQWPTNDRNLMHKCSAYVSIFFLSFGSPPILIKEDDCIQFFYLSFSHTFFSITPLSNNPRQVVQVFSASCTFSREMPEF